MVLMGDSQTPTKQALLLRGVIQAGSTSELGQVLNLSFLNCRRKEILLPGLL